VIPCPATRPPAINLEYHLREGVSVEQPGFGRVERWAVSVLADAPGAGHDDGRVGYARLIVLNPPPGTSVADLADGATGDWVDPISPLAGPTGPIGSAGSTADEAAVLGEHILVLDRLWLEPAWRGRGLGPVVATAAILRLGRGCKFGVCYPAPFEPADRPEDRARSIEALGAIWAQVGFRPWADGVWVMDLGEVDLGASLERLLLGRPTDCVTPSR
jgi:hypothetical protein